MIALYDIPVAEEDIRTLVDLLLRGDTADGLVAAEAIERGLAVEAKLLALTPAIRTATVGVLEDPPDRLAELRGKLLRDFEWRHRKDSLRPTRSATLLLNMPGASAAMKAVA